MQLKYSHKHGENNIKDYNMEKTISKIMVHL